MGFKRSCFSTVVEGVVEREPTPAVVEQPLVVPDPSRTPPAERPRRAKRTYIPTRFGARNRAASI